MKTAKLAILTFGSKGAYSLARAAERLGWTTLVSDFASYEDRQELLKCDVFIPRVSSRSYGHAIEIAKLYEANCPEGVISVSSLGILESFNKFLAYEKMSKNEVPTPKSWLVKSSDDLKSLSKALPLILKPLSENRGKDIIIAKTGEELSHAAKMLLSSYGEFLAQEFVEESAGKDIRAFVVGGHTIAAMERIGKPGSNLANLALGGVAEKIELTKHEENIAVKAAKSFGAKFAGVDILRGKNGPVVIEVNVSPGFKISEITKTDVQTKILDYLKGSLHD